MKPLPGSGHGPQTVLSLPTVLQLHGSSHSSSCSPTPRGHLRETFKHAFYVCCSPHPADCCSLLLCSPQSLTCAETELSLTHCVPGELGPVAHAARRPSAGAQPEARHHQGWCQLTQQTRGSTGPCGPSRLQLLAQPVGDKNHSHPLAAGWSKWKLKNRGFFSLLVGDGSLNQLSAKVMKPWSG